MNAVKTNLKRLRTARKMTQDELAEKLCVVRQTVSSWETGKTTPDVETLTAIAAALEVNITELIYGEKTVDTDGLKKQKKVRTAAFLCGLSAVFALMSVVWMDILRPFGITQIISSATFRPVAVNAVLISFGLYFLPSLAYPCAGMAAVSVVDIFRPVSIESRVFRVVLFVLGLIPVLIYWSQMIFFVSKMCSYAAQTEKVFMIDTRLLFWFYYHHYALFPCGIFLSLGIRK